MKKNTRGKYSEAHGREFPLTTGVAASPPPRTAQQGLEDDARSAFNRDLEMGPPLPDLSRYPDLSASQLASLTRNPGYGRAREDVGFSGPTMPYNSQQQHGYTGYGSQGQPSFMAGQVYSPYMTQQPGTQAQTYFLDGNTGRYAPETTYRQGPLPQVDLRIPTPRIPKYHSQTLMENPVQGRAGAGQVRGGTEFGVHQTSAQNMGSGQATTSANGLLNTSTTSMAPPSDRRRKRGPDNESTHRIDGRGSDHKRHHGGA
jgi:hypothetical protein